MKEIASGKETKQNTKIRLSTMEQLMGRCQMSMRFHWKVIASTGDLMKNPPPEALGHAHISD
eukprot:634200-Ditylum_brightwellii.AAC.1